MADLEHLFIHPLMGEGDVWSGFLVETAEGCPSNQEMFSQFSQHSALDSFDKHSPWFFPATLALDANLPEKHKTQVVITFPAQPIPGANMEKLRKLETELRQARTKVALRTNPNQKLPVTNDWDYALITCSHARSLTPFTLQGLANDSLIIATDVLCHADYKWVKGSPCALATTEFLLNRYPQDRKADLTRLKLLELLALLINDADTYELESVFRQEPKLAYSLLRLVNSAAIAARGPITSFSQAINMLGRRQLQRWLQLLVFADQNSSQDASPLLQKAATRGRIMELIAAKLDPGKESKEHFLDAAFMIGTFSLLHILLNLPVKEVMLHLPLPNIVRQALAEETGPLGQLLQAVCATESRNLPIARELLRGLSITPETHLDAQLAALHWAASIQQPN